MIKVEECKRRLGIFLVSFAIIIMAVGGVEYYLTNEFLMSGLILVISPGVSGLYICSLMVENLTTQNNTGEKE